MTYNKRNIKPFKGRLIEIEFIPKIKGAIYPHKLTGEITANTDEHILFRVNKTRPEIPLNYSQIKNISDPELVY
jgi:hypothetical protein